MNRSEILKFRNSEKIKQWKITEDEYLKGRDKFAPLNDKQKENMFILLFILNEIREVYKKPLIVSSGYRPPNHNLKVKGATNSAHISCEACDILDLNGDFKKWILQNVELMIKYDVYIEHFDYTPNWVHLQIRKTKQRFFIP